MTVLNDTNKNRVIKIVETVELLGKSAASNKATQDDIWNLMSPAMEAITELVNGEVQITSEPMTDLPKVPEPVSKTPRTEMKEPTWVCIKAAAEEASLKDLTYAMAVYLNRIDEHLKG